MSQRAVVASKLANTRLGDNQHKKEGVQICTPSISLEQATKLLDVGRAAEFHHLAQSRTPPPEREPARRYRV